MQNLPAVQSSNQAATFHLLSASLNKTLQTLGPDEKVLISRKYSAPAFGSLDEAALKITTNALILKIHVITGWSMPDELLHDELQRQLSQKLLEKYPTVNIHEVEFSFRDTGIVKDWGKNMNLFLIDEVMLPYLEKRREASEAERCARSKPKTELPPPPMTDEEVIQMARSTWNSSKNYSFIAHTVYERLKISLSEEEKTGVRTRALIELQNLQDKDPEILKNMDRSKFLSRLAKKIAVADYFDNEQ